MTIIGIVGTYDDSENIPIIGNGKTCLETFYLHEDKEKDGREIYTNYYTTFSNKLTTKEIFDLVLGGKLRESSIGIDEITGFLNSLGTEPHKIRFLEKVVGQSRKRGLDIYWTAQRFKSAPLRLRAHTFRLLIPYKTHLDNSACLKSECKLPHKIWIYSQIPFIEEAIGCIYAEEVGKLYDTNEIIDEEFNVKTDKELRKEAMIKPLKI
jgi:hypothetical protein